MQTNPYLSQYCSHMKLQGRHSVDEHARRHARKICMSIYSINSTTIQKRNVMCVSALQTFQRERKRERKCWQNGLLAHTYHSQTFLAPPTCLCTVVTDGTLNELPLERWWGRRRGWERDKQCLTQVAKKPLQSFHCTNSLFFQLSP